MRSVAFHPSRTLKPAGARSIPITVRLVRLSESTSSPSTSQFDPYENFKFKVKWEGRYVAGVSKISALRRTTEVVVHREGGDPSSSRKSPGRTEFEPVTLERGILRDIAFEKWANEVWRLGAGPGQESDVAHFRKDVIIDFFDEAGNRVLSYRLYRCWVSEYQALPDLDADADSVAIELIKLENEGWDRDPAVTPPP